MKGFNPGEGGGCTVSQETTTPWGRLPQVSVRRALSICFVHFPPMHVSHSKQRSLADLTPIASLKGGQRGVATEMSVGNFDDQFDHEGSPLGPGCNSSEHLP